MRAFQPAVAGVTESRVMTSWCCLVKSMDRGDRGSLPVLREEHNRFTEIFQETFLIILARIGDFIEWISEITRVRVD